MGNRGNPIKKIYSKFLLIGAHLFEMRVLYPINSVFAWAYSEILPIVIENILKIRFHLSEIKVLARHSSKERVGFNIFLSDLDLSLILGQRDISKCKDIIQFLSQLRRVVIFLGEVEIYSPEEYAKLESCLSLNGALYNSLRTIRKIRWIEADLEKSLSTYHKYKALRSISICFQKLGYTGYAALVAGNLKNLTGVISALLKPYMESGGLAGNALSINELAIDEKLLSSGVPVDYFQCVLINESAAENPYGLCLRGDLALTLISLTPLVHFHSNELDKLVSLKRASNMPLAQAWQSICEIEYLILSGVIRGSATEQEWMTPSLIAVKNAYAAATS
ncbi:MAG: hypothetical protein KDD38_00715 [Bdellovibrionales bacterium]|nr:hypothetical protein [Bdellovibrionales bacterium]